jgi:hypothetical protein
MASGQIKMRKVDGRLSLAMKLSRRRRSVCARPHLRSACSQPQMDCCLHVCLGGGGLAQCGRRRSLLSRVAGWSMSAAMMAQLVTEALVMG